MVVKMKDRSSRVSLGLLIRFELWILVQRDLIEETKVLYLI